MHVGRLCSGVVLGPALLPHREPDCLGGKGRRFYSPLALSLAGLDRTPFFDLPPSTDQNKRVRITWGGVGRAGTIIKKDALVLYTACIVSKVYYFSQKRMFH